MTINYTTGYAGTGKSTELLKLCKSLPVDTSVVLCPTHKAIVRLMHDIHNIEIKTIHSLLGWVPTINEEAEHINHIDTTKKLGKELDYYTDIVIDEAGMMSEEMLMEITAKIEEQNNFETEHVTLHLFLDPYQLLPVKGKQIQIDPLTTTNLTTQHRAESPDVVELFTKFVRFLEGTNTRDLKVLPSDNVHFMKDISAFQKGDRLLAYTNECVGKYNNLIAEKFNINSYNGQNVQLGNLLDLVRVEKFVSPNLNSLLQAYEAGKLYMQNNQISKKWVKENLQALLDCEAIQFITLNNHIIPVIPGTNNAYVARRKAKEAAILDKHMFKWVYAMNRAFTMDYSFASTVHKAQGSEFNRVWIAQEDIKKSITNGYYMNYARLMYVAISRSRQKVFIV